MFKTALSSCAARADWNHLHFISIQADMTSKDDLQRVVAEIEKQSGAVHILIK